MTLLLYLGLFWQTAEASGCGVTLNLTRLPPYTTIPTTRGARGRNGEGREAGILTFMEPLKLFPPCRGCRPPSGTVDGPPPSCPRCTAALVSDRQEPGTSQENANKKFSGALNHPKKTQVLNANTSMLMSRVFAQCRPTQLRLC